MKKLMPAYLVGIGIGLILMLNLLPVRGGSTYYVATNGSDSNSGSASSPFATLQKGVNVAKPGDLVLVKDGAYGCNGAGTSGFAVNVNTAGISGAPITLRSENKWGATLDSANSCYGYFNLQGNSAWIVIDGFKILRGYASAITANSGGAKNITVRNNEIAYVGNGNNPLSYGLVGIFTDQAAIMTVDSNVFHDIGRSNDMGNSFDHALYFKGQITATNNVFYRALSGWHIQTAQGFSAIINQNTFYGSNPYPGKYGQVMIWEGGSISMSKNIFALPNGPAVVTYAANPSSCTIAGNFTTSGQMFDGGATCSVSASILNSDPKFVNPTADFHLQAGSTAATYGAFPVPVSPGVPCSKTFSVNGTVVTNSWIENGSKCP